MSMFLCISTLALKRELPERIYRYMDVNQINCTSRKGLASNTSDNPSKSLQNTSYYILLPRF